jgi:uncharacterized protein (TIGR02444 family)
MAARIREKEDQINLCGVPLMTYKFEEHPFWDFSLSVYGKGGVPEACIALQDRHRLDVNILLFCLYNGFRGIPMLTPEKLTEIIDMSRGWNREIVRGLRAVRLSLTEDFSGVPEKRLAHLRRQVLEIEIDCEHAEQLSLAGEITSDINDSLPPQERCELSLANLKNYFDALDVRVGAAEVMDLTAILTATYPALEQAEVFGLCEEFCSP